MLSGRRAAKLAASFVRAARRVQKAKWAAGPEAVDLTKETEATKKLYGMDEEATSKLGTNCLLARRLVERGVRFVELYSGSGSGWDAHNDIEGNH